MKQMEPFAGKWRIVEMEDWGQDEVDMEVPADIFGWRRVYFPTPDLGKTKK